MITSPIILPDELPELISEFNGAFHNQRVEFDHRLYFVFYMSLLKIVAGVVQPRCTDIPSGALQGMCVKLDLIPVLILHFLCQLF